MSDFNPMIVSPIAKIETKTGLWSAKSLLSSEGHRIRFVERPFDRIKETTTTAWVEVEVARVVSPLVTFTLLMDGKKCSKFSISSQSVLLTSKGPCAVSKLKNEDAIVIWDDYMKKLWPKSIVAMYGEGSHPDMFSDKNTVVLQEAIRILPKDSKFMWKMVGPSNVIFL